MKRAALLALAVMACDLEPQVTLAVDLPNPLTATELLAKCDGVDTPETHAVLGVYVDDEGNNLGWSLTFIAAGNAAQTQCLREQMLAAGAVETWTDP